jgi:uncharacterized protein (DUF2236 family)
VGRFLPSLFSNVLAPATYPLLKRGYFACAASGVSAATCKSVYVASVCAIALLAVAFVLAWIVSVRHVAKQLRARRALMDAAPSSPSPLPISRSVIDRVQYERALRRTLEYARGCDGLLDMGDGVDESIAAESIAILGGGPAVLAQLAHPYVAWAVREHSYSLEDTKRRFYNTFSAVFALTFGTLDVAEKASRRVFLTHMHVHGTIPQTVGAYHKGDRYAASDEEAAIWVLATLIDYSIAMRELFVDELTDAHKETNYQFHKRVCGVWGIDEAHLPATYRDFVQYCAHMWHSQRLVVTPDALALAGFLLRPLPWEAALGLNTYAQLTAYLLPQRLAQAFELRTPLSTTSASFWLMCSGIGLARLVYKLVPLSVRQFTESAKRQARKRGTPLRWYTRVGSAVGGWFVNGVLNAEMDQKFSSKLQQQKTK